MATTDFTYPAMFIGNLFYGPPSTDGTFNNMIGPIETDKLAIKPTASIAAA